MKRTLSWSLLLLVLLGVVACAPETTPDSGTSESGESGASSSEVSEPIEVAGDFPAATFQSALDERTVDHAKGADEPLLTVIEYGDFQ